MGFVLGRRDQDGARFIAVTTVGSSLKALGAASEQIGRSIWVDFDEDMGRNTFKVLEARL